MLPKFKYFSLIQYSEYIFKDKGSKFIACAKPIEDIEAFKDFLVETKLKYPGAVHYCYAYRIGIADLIYRINDDGEPSGSAGKPIYNQLLSYKLDNVAIIVVRYFGGTLLGVSGLINAYKTASEESIKLNSIEEYQVMKQIDVEFDYIKMNDFMRSVKKWNLKIIRQESDLKCRITLEYPLEFEEKILVELNFYF